MEMKQILDSTKSLIVSDLVYARIGSRPLFFLDQLNFVATKEEIWRLSQGKADRARYFVNKRERNIEESIDSYREKILKGNIQNKVPDDFVTIRENWDIRRSLLDKSPYSERAHSISDEVLFAKPEIYPFMNTFINANLYSNFIALKNPKGPSKRLISDYRHLISSNAGDYFLTNDKGIIRNASLLSPYLRVIQWDSFEKMKMS